MNDIKEIAAALCEFQKAMPVLKKTGQNFQKGTAATIGDVVTIAMKGCKYGLSFSQKVHHRVQPETGVTTCFVETIMMHGASGQWLSSGEYPITPAKPNDPASFGSAQTYAKKTSHAAVYDPPPDTPDGKTEVETPNLSLVDELANCKSHEDRLAAARRAFKTDTPAQRQPTIEEAKMLLNLTDAGDLMDLFNTMRPENQIIIEMFSKRKEGETV